MTATIRDVAKAAGVSASTVSRALADSGAVSPATKERVVAAARRLNYVPDPAARRLITGRSGNIGLIVPDLGNPFFADLAKGVQQRARELGCATFISDCDEQVSHEIAAVRQLARQVDGIIMASPRMAESELAELATNTTIVLLHRQYQNVPCVVADWADGMRQAVRNLHALGHRRIAYIDGPQNSWSGLRRRVGLLSTAQELDCQIIELGRVSSSFDGGQVAADLLMASDATAVIGYNDTIMLGVLGRLHDRGVRVPEELSLIGCDGIRMSEMTRPPLTTVDVPRAEAGASGVDLLQRVLLGESTHHFEVLLPTRLVVRGTTAVAAG